MNIEQELEGWLNSHIPERRREKRRNIRAVLDYYGFGENVLPTMEEIGEDLEIGTRERVRQIIADNFRSVVDIRQLPITLEIFGILQSVDCSPAHEIVDQLMRQGLASKNTTVRGLLRLAKDLKVCPDYELCNGSLQKLTKADAELDGTSFLVQKEELVRLRKNLKKAKGLPKALGLAKLDYLKSEVHESKELESLIRFVKSALDCCIVKQEGEEWYVFEDRDSTLIHSCEKVFSLADQYRLPVLASALQNSLRKRAHKYGYPPTTVVSSWIKKSKRFIVENEVVRFLGGDRECTEVESAAISYLSQRKTSDYPTFCDHLLRLGFGEPNVVKAITVSPFVVVDKSGPRGSYKYQLISKVGVTLPRFHRHLGYATSVAG